MGLVTVLVSIVWTGSLPLSTTASADSGCPTAAEPPKSGSVYQVSTPAHFQWIKDANDSGSNAQWTYSYVQTANIDMAACTWSSVIASGSEFSGTFDGSGFTISNLTLSGATNSNNGIGVFARVGTTATIRETHLRNVTLTTSDSNVGLLVGALTGTLQQSSAAGSLTGGGNLGGLVGNNGGVIEDSWADVTVNDPSSGTSGGLVGVNGIGGTVGAIRRSFSTGIVLATGAGSRSGGLVGWNASGSIISDSYATGSVTGGSNAGGLVGDNRSSVSRSYATGSVSASTAHGLIGAASGSPSYTANFWDTQTSGQSSPGPGGSEATGKTTAQMTTYATFADAGWSITNGYSTSTTWGICPQFNNGYPFLTAIQSGDVCAGAAQSDPETIVLELDAGESTGCRSTTTRGTRGTWISLPLEVTCDTSDDVPSRTLLGWATRQDFPVDVAQRQFDNGWGAYETFDDTGRLTGVFVPAGGSTFLSLSGRLFAVWDS